MSIKYFCNYVAPDGKNKVVKIERISDVTNGFWINDKGEYTVGDDCLFWIPLNKVNFVHRVKNDE